MLVRTTAASKIHLSDNATYQDLVDKGVVRTSRFSHEFDIIVEPPPVGANLRHLPGLSLSPLVSKNTTKCEFSSKLSLGFRIA
jgi:hypothetical protein